MEDMGNLYPNVYVLSSRTFGVGMGILCNDVLVPWQKSLRVPQSEELWRECSSRQTLVISSTLDKS